jgi:hypothetical protein
MKAVILSLLLVAFGLSAAPANAGISIKYVQSSSKPVPAGEQATKSVSCPLGMRVVSGGVYTGGVTVDDEVAESYPSDGPDPDDRSDDAWTGTISAGAADTFVRTHAVCAAGIPLTFRKEKSDLAPGPQQATATCPTETYSVGGGIDLAGKSTKRTIYTLQAGGATVASRRVWYNGVNNDTANTVEAISHVICRPATFAVEVGFSSGSVNPGQQGSLIAHCPAGTKVIGGGAITFPAATSEIASVKPYDDEDEGSRPDDGWIAWFNNSGGTSSNTSIDADCV